MLGGDALLNRVKYLIEQYIYDREWMDGFHVEIAP